MMQDATQTQQRPRVAMLVVNDGNDIRVLKEARSLAKAGYNVKIFGRFSKDQLRNDTIGGIPIERVSPIGSATKLWTHIDRTKMPLAPNQSTDLRKVYTVWKSSGYTIGYQYTKPTSGATVHSKTQRPPSRLERAFQRLKSPSRISNWLTYNGSRILARVGAPQKRLRTGTVGDPQRSYIENEFLIHALEFYDAVTDFAPDVVHSHDLYTLRAGVVLKQALGCRLVYDAHELERDRVKSYPDWRKQLCQNEEDELILSADKVITVSSSIGDILERETGCVKPTIIFNTSFSSDARRERVRQKFGDIKTFVGLLPKTPLIVHIGKLYDMHRQTGMFKELIDTLVNLERGHLALLGPCSNRAKRQVHEWASRIGVEDRVHVVPPVPYECVPHFVETADIGIVAMYGDNLNTEYAMPNKLFEMALASLPIITSDQFEIRNFISKYAKGLTVDCDRVAEIERAIREIVENPSRFQYTAEQIETLRRDHSWDAQERKILALYADLAPLMTS